MKKVVSFLCALVLCVSCVSCSSQKNKQETADNSEEINQKYDELFGNKTQDIPIGSGASVLGENFSTVDFTFTSADDTVAFTLANNSFAKINSGGTYYNTIAPGGELMTFDPGFKTARGLTLQNSAKEFLNKYKIADENALYVKADDTVYYNPANGNFTGRLTALFASADSVTYSILSSKDVQTFIYTRDANANGAYMDPSAIMSDFPAYQSIVSVDITTDGAGNLTEVAFYKFDK